MKSDHDYKESAMSLPRNATVCVLSALLLSACSLFGERAAESSVAAPAPAVAPAVARMATSTSLEERYRCGALVATLRQLGDGASLAVDGRSWALRPEPAASGVKRVAVDDERTLLWTKGNSALLEIDGVRQPECTLVSEDRVQFRAVGNEPGWRLDVTARALVLLTEGGDTRVVAPGLLLEARTGLRHYRADSAQGELSVTVVERLCVDSMSAMPHPAAVEVSWQGQTLRGCGGEPMDLLVGEAWQVIESEGARVAELQQMTLVFGSDGRIAGIAACNRYSGAFSLSGEGLRLSQIIATRMACAPALMDKEQRFLAALGAVTGFAIGVDGSLELKSGARVLMRARRK